MKKLILDDIKWFALILAGSAIIWAFIFAQMYKPADNEKITLFVTAERCDSGYLEQKILSAADLKQATVVCYSHSDRNYSELFQVQGLLSADIIILKAEELADKAMTTAFLPLTDDILHKYGIPTDKLVYFESVAYAVKIYDAEAGVDVFGDKFGFSENASYCIGINITSKNADAGGDDNALKVLASLLAG